MTFAPSTRQPGRESIPALLGPFLSLQDASTLSQVSRVSLAEYGTGQRTREGQEYVAGVLGDRVQKIRQMLDEIPSEQDLPVAGGGRMGGGKTLRRLIYEFNIRFFDPFDVRDGNERFLTALWRLILKMLHNRKVIDLKYVEQEGDNYPADYPIVDRRINQLFEDGFGFAIEVHRALQLVFKIALGLPTPNALSQEMMERVYGEGGLLDERGGDAEGGGGGGSSSGEGGGGGGGGASSGGGARGRKRRAESDLEGGKTYYKF
jgi:hypothetical protein